MLNYLYNEEDVFYFCFCYPLLNGEQYSKLFEYIGARKTILALVPDGEAKDLIVKENLGITVDSKDIEGIKNAIFKFYNDWEQKKLKIEGDGRVYKKYGMRVLTKKLVDTIEEIPDSV